MSYRPLPPIMPICACSMGVQGSGVDLGIRD
jgi:hypothetical protein